MEDPAQRPGESLRARALAAAVGVLASALSGCKAGSDTSGTRSAPEPAQATAAHPRPDHLDAPAISCSGEPGPGASDGAALDRRRSGVRSIYCAIDAGSNNVKLQIVSMEPGAPGTLRNERQCRARLGLGSKVFDAQTNGRRVLAAADVDRLVAVAVRMRELCGASSGLLVGMFATQWARDAVNTEGVTARLRSALGIEVEVLTPEAEGLYGYAAATRNAPGRVSLDPGSNSFQLGFWMRGTPSPSSVSVPLGYVRAAARFYADRVPEAFPAQRRAHAAEVTTKLAFELAKSTPRVELSALRRAVHDGRLDPVLFVMGQDGAIHLPILGTLRDEDGRWLDTKAAYYTRLSASGSRWDRRFGEISALLGRADIGRWLDRLRPDDARTLGAEPVRSLYGDRALANSVLIHHVMRELGLGSAVIVPQETAAGFILSKLARNGD